MRTTQIAAMPTTAAALVLRAMCADELKKRDLTADEVATLLGKSVLTIRPRISELARAGVITDSGNRRSNASGHNAIVWKISLYEPFISNFRPRLLRHTAFDVGLSQRKICPDFGVARRLANRRGNRHDRHNLRGSNSRKTPFLMIREIKVLLWIEAAILGGLLLGSVVWHFIGGQG